jgi:enamine deaminase RidA (YjgF/YER057c/UK114 family)
MFGFCRAMRVGNLVYVAGTAPIGEDGKTVGAGDPAAQARRCFDIVKQALEKLDASLEDIVRTRMYLTRAEDSEAVGRVHGEYFKNARPVATMVQIEELIDPDWLIEVEADAVVNDRD